MVRILVVGTLTYLGIVLILRFSGKRTLSKMSAFDFIITVAMGSAFGRILTASKVSVSEALTAFLLLVLLQSLVSRLETLSPALGKMLNAPPVLLYYNGNFVKKNLKAERIQEKDLLSAVRSNQLESMEQVKAIVMETNGNLTVIKKTGSKTDSFDSLL